MNVDLGTKGQAHVTPSIIHRQLQLFLPGLAGKTRVPRQTNEPSSFEGIQGTCYFSKSPLLNRLNWYS